MELTLDSAFSTGGLVGHLSYILLIVSMLMRNINHLRILVIASAITAICYDWFWLRDPVGVFWESILLLVSLAMLCIEYFQNLNARFTEEETKFIIEHLPDLAHSSARKLLDAGNWINEEQGVHLVYEKAEANHLYYISAGTVNIHKNGKSITSCDAGNFIGEMSVQSGERAIATATVSKKARLWSIRKSILNEIIGNDKEIASALEASFSRNYRVKFENTNQALMKR